MSVFAGGIIAAGEGSRLRQSGFAIHAEWSEKKALGSGANAG